MSKLSWTPSEFLDTRFALLVLNTEIVDVARAQKLWEKAHFRLLVDGGANRVADITLDPPLPHLVTGDLDSIRPEVRRSLAERGVPIVETPDQDHTDFTKALLQLAERNLQLDYVLALTENRGRLDQIFSVFETLCHATANPKLPPVILVSSTSLSWLLEPGINHVIRVKDLNQSCGLIPLGSPAKGVITEGLKWNLTDGLLAFGRLVSTSNTFASDSVTVKFRSGGPLLWTQERE